MLTLAVLYDMLQHIIYHFATGYIHLAQHYFLFHTVLATV